MKRLNFQYWYNIDFSIFFLLSGRDLHRDALLLPTALGFTIPLPYHVSFFSHFSFLIVATLCPPSDVVCVCVCAPLF